MKNFFLTLVLVSLISSIGVAQLTFEHSYLGAAEIGDAGPAGSKYYVTDYLLTMINVYNEDHSLWKTVPIPLPANQSLYDIAYVSTNVFNPDNLLEYLVVSYQYTSTSDTTGYYTYLTRVLNENGNTLASIPGGAYSFTLTTLDNKTKLIVYTYDYSVSSYISTTEIYGLPGTVAVGDLMQAQLLPYPNPAENLINLPSGIAGSEGTGELVVRDANGVEVLRRELTGSAEPLTINTNHLAPGVYTYFMLVHGKSIPAGKFIRK